MTSYARLTALVTAMPSATAPEALAGRVVPMLVDLWLDDYAQRWKTDQIVTVTDGPIGAELLFDVALGRLIAAWALSRGKSDQVRDKGRMRGAPVGGNRLYHRGHAIPNSLGGGLDINLVPQLGSINIGAFRRLENKAVDHAGSLYFSHWLYNRGGDSKGAQRPYQVEQGVLIPGRAPDIARHVN